MQMRTYGIALGLLLAATGGSSATILSDGSFESPAMTAGQFTYPAQHSSTYPGGIVGGWAFSTGATNSGSGIASGVGSSLWFTMGGESGPALWNGAAGVAGVDGNQFAFLQGTSTLSQQFTVAATGNYSLSWLDAGRPAKPVNPGYTPYDGNQTYEVLLDGSLMGTYSTSSDTPFTSETLSGQLFLSQGTEHVLAFVGTKVSDSTAFLDDVVLAAGSDAVLGAATAVPEPGTATVLFAATLILCGVKARGSFRSAT